MDIKEITKILKMCELFFELTDDELRSIANLCQVEKYDAGDHIHEQGCIGTKLYILARGHVTLEREIDLYDNRKAKVNVFSLL
jgi:signal-transduction protein with cAMP-binding, CBS, and nucleotidyltransferase domain